MHKNITRLIILFFTVSEILKIIANRTIEKTSFIIKFYINLIPTLRLAYLLMFFSKFNKSNHHNYELICYEQ